MLRPGSDVDEAKPGHISRLTWKNGEILEVILVLNEHGRERMARGKHKPEAARSKDSKRENKLTTPA